MLNPIHLATMLAVIRTGSFAMAARELGYTPSAVSQQMAALEGSVGMVLFERGARDIRPTVSAELLAEASRPMLAMLESLEAQVRDLAGGRSGRLRLGSFPTASERIVPGVLSLLAERLPNLRIELEEDEPDVLLPLVEEGRIDLALIYEYAGVPRQWPAELQQTVLLEEEVGVLMPVGHRLADAEAVSMADVMDEVWVATRRGTAAAVFLERLSAASGFVPRVSFRSSDYDVIRRLVRAGLGIALVPALGHEGESGTVIRPMATRGLLRRVLAVRRAVGAIPATDEVLDACLTAVRSLRGLPGLSVGD